jgi:succinate dehydrogenase/fumarate reductase flavoprotein subunit
MKSALKKYARMLIKQKAYTEIIDNLKPAALQELQKCKDGQAVVSGIEFHCSTSTTKTFPDDIKERIKTIKDEAEKNNRVDTESKPILVAEIPKSTKEGILSKVADYKNHFFPI